LLSKTSHLYLYRMFSEPYFLGLDASTQSLKASLLSADLDVIKELAVNFDADLPKYQTKGGVLVGPEGSGEVFSPVMMVVEAMDLLFERIKTAGWDLEKVRGVAAAGQVSLYALSSNSS
jgi:xylulokinase